jgi:hypothetical protein
LYNNGRTPRGLARGRKRLPLGLGLGLCRIGLLRERWRNRCWRCLLETALMLQDRPS